MVETLVKDIIPQNDKQRIEALRRFEILSTSAEDAFDNITRMMAQVFDTPMSFISLVDKEQVFYKSQVGPFGRDSVNRGHSLCSLTILGTEPLIIEDASGVACLQDNPYVTAEGGIRFYAGAPLITRDGYQIGTACIVDTKSRTFSEKEKSLLVSFAGLVMHEIEMKQVSLQQREAEEALTISKERFELVSKATQDAVWDWNLKTDQIWWNEGFKVLFEYKEEEIEPTIDFWYSRVHPEDKDWVINGIHEVIDKGGKNWSAEYRFRKADGSYAFVLDRGYALHNREGQPYRMLGSMQDITKRKKAEAAIESQRQLIATIANNTTSTLFMMNKEGFCTFINSTGERMFGYTLEELREKPMHDFIHHHHPDGSPYPREACPLENALRKNCTIQTHRELFFRKDGSSFPASCSASPVFENGVAVSAVIEIRDITLQAEAEQLLRRSAHELEQLVQDRTQELRQVNEQLKQFTYAASHDLQEPLRKISYFLDRLLSNIGPSLSEDNKKLTERIQHTANRMRSLIDDLLAYSNTTLGITNFKPVDLTSIVKDVLDDLEVTIIEKGAQVRLQDLPRVKGDQRQLRQLFQNLISNAVKYHKKDEAPQVQITSRLVQAEDMKAYVPRDIRSELFYEIEVKDNGIGFDPDDAERIFRLFQRLHGKAEYEGTGVGLAIVQKVVENHNGYVWAESEPGEGATFRILLPAE